MSDEQPEARNDTLLARKDEQIAHSKEVRKEAADAIGAFRRAVDTLVSTQIDIARIIDYPRWQNWIGREEK